MANPRDIDEPIEPIQTEKYTILLQECRENGDKFVVGQDGCVYLKSDYEKFVGKPSPVNPAIILSGPISGHLATQFVEFIENQNAIIADMKEQNVIIADEIKAHAKLAREHKVELSVSQNISKEAVKVMHSMVEDNVKLEEKLEEKETVIAEKEAEIASLKAQLEKSKKRKDVPEALVLPREQAKKKHKAEALTFPEDQKAHSSKKGMFGRIVLLKSEKKNNKIKLSFRS